MDMMQEAAGPPPYPMGPAVEHTAKPIIGGILIMLSALVGIVYGIWMAAVSGAIESMMPVTVPGMDAFTSIVMICGIILLVFGIIALLGGIFAIKRTHFGLAILGGIFSLLSPGIIFGLIGLIVVAISKKEFS